MFVGSTADRDPGGASGAVVGVSLQDRSHSAVHADDVGADEVGGGGAADQQSASQAFDLEPASGRATGAAQVAELLVGHEGGVELGGEVARPSIRRTSGRRSRRLEGSRRRSGAASPTA